MTALYPSPQTETYKIMCLVPQPDVQRLKRYRITPDEPIAADADPFGMVRWNPRLPGMLMAWHDVRDGEAWTHSAAWQAPSCGPSY
jgi:hypothetical protein